MTKNIEERDPLWLGKGILPECTAIQSPWGKLIGYKDAMHYASRYSAVVSAATMQALRILIPDYEARAQLLCEEAFGRLTKTAQDAGPAHLEEFHIHPFCRGAFIGALNGDKGDEALLMCGRVNDFGTYRAEKELDICDWDIVGSELCRETTMSLQAGANVMASRLRKGPSMEYCMVEAKGCGDLHCRIVAESREKYPMPEHKLWESFGPIATADQIKFTPEEECIKESMIFREECNYTFTNGTNVEVGPESATMLTFCNAATFYVLPGLDYAIKKGVVDEKFAHHVLHCVCEAAGKAACGETVTKDAIISWLGAPKDINDGRLMGGYLEMYLQSMTVSYEIEAFNKDEVIYVVDRGRLALGYETFIISLMAYWNGMTKTLVNAQWFLWEEDSPEGKLRIKIAKKVDKFC